MLRFHPQPCVFSEEGGVRVCERGCSKASGCQLRQCLGGGGLPAGLHRQTTFKCNKSQAKQLGVLFCRAPEGLCARRLNEEKYFHLHWFWVIGVDISLFTKRHSVYWLHFYWGLSPFLPPPKCFDFITWKWYTAPQEVCAEANVRKIKLLLATKLAMSHRDWEIDVVISCLLPFQWYIFLPFGIFCMCGIGCRLAFPCSVCVCVWGYNSCSWVHKHPENTGSSFGSPFITASSTVSKWRAGISQPQSGDDHPGTFPGPLSADVARQSFYLCILIWSLVKN